MNRITDWMRISLILCTFGFFREMRPSEPFVVEFLSGKWRNVTTEQVNREVYPWGTYSYMAQLVIVFLITDILRYKPIIVISACVGIVLWSLLLWTYTLLGLKIVQLCFGFFMSAEVAYYTYSYAKVDREKYQQVTGHTRSAILSGKFLAAILAQVIVSFDYMDLRQLNYISLAAQVLSLFFAILLPPVGRSFYFYAPVEEHKEIKEIPASDPMRSGALNITPGNNISQDSLEKAQINVKFSWRKAIKLIWRQFVSSYSNSTVLQWSIWWALATCGFLQVVSYIQVLWKEIDENRDNFYNGAVEAILTLLGAAGAAVAGFLNSGQNKKWDLWTLTLCSLAEGGFLLLAALTNSVRIAYMMYILFGTVYHFMITVASAIIAKNLSEDSFGLVFGINTLVALIMQTIFTIAVISETGFALNPQEQFIAFGGYFIVLAAIYAITAVVNCA